MRRYCPFPPRHACSSLKSVDRALLALELLCIKGELGISQLARLQSTTTSTAHRILTTLVAHGFAAKDQLSGKYVLGQKLCTLTAMSLESIPALKWAGSYLQELTIQTKETALFTVYSESDYSMVIVAQTLSPYPLQVRCHLLHRIPLHVSAFGGSYLMTLPQQMLDNILRYCRFQRFTKNTVSSAEKLKAQVAEFIKQGYALCREDMFAGILSIASPVINCMKKFAGSIGVICPTSRVDYDKERRIGKTVSVSAKKMSNDLIANAVI